jgi:Flp pilus assembly pilin Flp
MEKTCRYIKELWQDEGGQDLIEYSLLLAFLAMTAMAMLITAGGSIKTVWSGINSQLNNAAS